VKDRDRIIRFEALYRLGCICCLLNIEFDPPLFQTGQRCEIHHQNAGGYAGQARLGDEFTIPGCLWHHRGVLKPGFCRLRMFALFGPSLARQSKVFRMYYGRDRELLDVVNKRIAPMLARAA
jgi:hypothetical protein